MTAETIRDLPAVLILFGPVLSREVGNLQIQLAYNFRPSGYNRNRKYVLYARA